MPCNLTLSSWALGIPNFTLFGLPDSSSQPPRRRKHCWTHCPDKNIEALRDGTTCQGSPSLINSKIWNLNRCMCDFRPVPLTTCCSYRYCYCGHSSPSAYYIHTTSKIHAQADPLEKGVQRGDWRHGGLKGISRSPSGWQSRNLKPSLPGYRPLPSLPLGKKPLPKGGHQGPRMGYLAAPGTHLALFLSGRDWGTAVEGKQAKC